MAIPHEAWLVASQGIFDQYLADLNNLNDKDTRAVFVMRGYNNGRLVFRAWQTLGYIIGEETVVTLGTYVQDIVYKPRYNEMMPPVPQNVQESGGVITCDPLSGYTIEVYQFVDDLFEYVGDLDSTARSAGVYVLVASKDGLQGLPSAHITIS